MRNRSETQITLVLIRHGATKSNEEHRYLGSTDEELSEEGKNKLAEYRKKQMYPAVDVIFASPMKRCARTAEILYPAIAPFWIAEWKEMDFGAFEGRNFKELQGDERYQAWIDSNGTLPFPEGESREAFILRCEKGFQRMSEELKQLCRSSEKKKINTVGIIAHGGTIMALLSRYHGGDYFDYLVENGGGYLCECKGEKGQYRLSELRKL